MKANESSRRLKFTAAILAACVLPLLTVGCGGFVADKDYKAFIAALGDTSFTVFPTVVRVNKDIGYDAEAAATLAEMIRTEKLATVTLSDRHVDITHGWHMNQAKMLRESSADLSAHIAAHPIDTAYAVLPEYQGGGKAFGGVVCNVVDKHGTPAFALVINSHNATFKSKNPKTPADCTEILITELRKHLNK